MKEKLNETTIQKIKKEINQFKQNERKNKYSAVKQRPMMMMARTRERNYGIVELEEKDFNTNTGIIKLNVLGGRDTFWYGICLKFEIGITNKYPQVPPTIKCLNPIDHPSIQKNGTICLYPSKNGNVIVGNGSLLFEIQRILFLKPRRMKNTIINFDYVFF